MDLHSARPPLRDQESHCANTSRLRFLDDPLQAKPSSNLGYSSHRVMDLGSQELLDASPSSCESIETRRDWEAYRREALPRFRVVNAVLDKYLIQRTQRMQLVSAIRKWKRISQILTKWQSYEALVASHRVYYLRKALLRSCWKHVTRCFLHWRDFTHQSAKSLQHLLWIYARHQQRIALGKWYHRLFLVDRLEEEIVARVWVRQDQRAAKVRLPKRWGI